MPEEEEIDEEDDESDDDITADISVEVDMMDIADGKHFLCN